MRQLSAYTSLNKQYSYRHKIHHKIAEYHTYLLINLSRCDVRNMEEAECERWKC